MSLSCLILGRYLDSGSFARIVGLLVTYKYVDHIVGREFWSTCGTKGYSLRHSGLSVLLRAVTSSAMRSNQILLNAPWLVCC
jgi:hypothetical protein